MSPGKKDAINLKVGDIYHRDNFTLHNQKVGEIIAIYDAIPRVGRFSHLYYEISTPKDGTHKLMIFKDDTNWADNEYSIAIRKGCKGYDLIADLL